MQMDKNRFLLTIDSMADKVPRKWIRLARYCCFPFNRVYFCFRLIKFPLLRFHRIWARFHCYLPTWQCQAVVKRCSTMLVQFQEKLPHGVLMLKRFATHCA